MPVYELNTGDTLRIIMPISSTSYFTSRKKKSGYAYDELKAFAKSKQYEVAVIVLQHEDSMVQALHDGRGDVIAYPIEKKAQHVGISYAGMERNTYSVLIRNIHSNQEIATEEDLGGKSIYVRKESRHQKVLEGINERIGGTIDIIPFDIDSLSQERIVRKVAWGEVDFCVSDNELAELSSKFYPALDHSLKLSEKTTQSWAVRSECEQLEKELNAWFRAREQIPYPFSYKQKYEKSLKRTYPPILNRYKNKISIYDNYFKLYGKTHNVDWRLLAAISYEESRFQNRIVSPGGAVGVMQLMPASARRFGCPKHKLKSPRENIHAGAKLVQFLYKYYDGEENPDIKLRAVLAAYNKGAGNFDHRVDTGELHAPFVNKVLSRYNQYKSVK